jgi:hypothetical protein
LVQKHSLDASFALRARTEAHVEATDGNRPQQALTLSVGEVVDLQGLREAAQ